MLESFEKERKLMKGPPVEDLLKIVEKEARGPKSKQILKKMFEVESPGHLYLIEFECPPVIERAKGALLWDVDGNEYIDLFSGFAVHNLGHCHPKVVAAMKNQLEKLVQWAEMPHQARVDLASALLDITPGKWKKRVQYVTTGGEGVELAMKLARYYTARPTIMAFHGGYHGRTMGAVTAASSAYSSFYQGYPVTALGAVHVPYAYCYRCIFGQEYPSCGMRCTKFIRELFKSANYGLRLEKSGTGITNVSGILVEPMLGAGGYIIPPNEFLKDLRSICDDYNLLLIDDEVQVGWGRTGKLWGCEHSGVTPDIMVVGKALGGGIPLAAVIARSEILEELGPGAHGTTFGGTPLACAVGLAVIETIRQEKLVERGSSIGEYFLKGFKDLAKDHPIIGHVDGKGVYIGFELVKDQKTKEPAVEELRAVHKECFKRGVLWPPGGGFYGSRGYLIAPLVIEKEQVDRVLEVFDEAFRTVSK